MHALALLLALLGSPEPDPPLEDLAAFPPWQECWKSWEFACAYQRWLTTHLMLNPWLEEDAERWEDEARHCRLCWDALADAARPRSDNAGLCESVRRQRLRKLKEMLGDEAYYCGRMPPPVPVWRLARAER